MTDIEIAQAARPLPITEVAAKAGIDERFVECYGRTKAKIDPALLKAPGEDGKLILDAKALDSMRMNVLLTPEAIANGWPVVMANKKAIIAVALVLLTAIYNILKKNESYNPEPYRKADRPLTHREISADQAILILQRQGCLVTSPAWLICSNFGRHMPACFRVPFSG